MKFNIKLLSVIMAALFLLSGCGEDETDEIPFESDADGVYYSINDEGESVPINLEDYLPPEPIVYTDEDGSYTPFTDENGGDIPFETDESGAVVTDMSGVPQTLDTTRDPLKPLEGVRVCFIYNGSVSGNTLNVVFESARHEVERALGVETFYIENVLVQQFEDAVNVAKEAGCSVIVAASNHFVKACNLAAKNEIDDTKYICYGGDNTDRNQSSVQPLVYQPVFVAGFIAAYNTDSNKVGIVADNNLFHANGIVNSFALGTKDLQYSSVEVALNWALSDSYDDTKAAIDNLVANGCDVVFLYQTTEYGIKYCESLGVSCIGFAYNMAELAPTTYLTGYSINLTNYLVGRVSRAQYDTFNAERYIGTMKKGDVIMLEVNTERTKDGTDRLAESMYKFIYDESAPVFKGEIVDTNEVIRVDKGAKLTQEQALEVDWLCNIIRPISNFSGPRSQSELFYSDLTVHE